MPGHPLPPPEILARLRAIARALPETYEESAWVGLRWRVRTHTFAHVFAIAGGKPQVYATAAGTDGPAVAMTFRSRIAELDRTHFTEPPFFRPLWPADMAAIFLDETVDWDDVAGLLEGSYRVQAPRKLVARLEAARR
ncbi:hypothetical protein [Caulobacter mirabilis]|uniref:MmcQ/YjbR family DNA-binding protein n=1 Tax=Caulobacter mirabilis TaxID=69666 RepID=A0A2D2AVH9_9CAUL|nr:hypothetical protein [Caulobacter mirabilis]ATQ41996.1 hypothetical protein CSW64_05995 [Caulobacter mirabilis]